MNTRHKDVCRLRVRRLYAFLTPGHDGGEWSVSRPGRLTHPRDEEPPTPTEQADGWATQPV